MVGPEGTKRISKIDTYLNVAEAFAYLRESIPDRAFDCVEKVIRESEAVNLAICCWKQRLEENRDTNEKASMSTPRSVSHTQPPLSAEKPEYQHYTGMLVVKSKKGLSRAARSGCVEKELYLWKIRTSTATSTSPSRSRCPVTWISRHAGNWWNTNRLADKKSRQE